MEIEWDIPDITYKFPKNVDGDYIDSFAKRTVSFEDIILAHEIVESDYGTRLEDILNEAAPYELPPDKIDTSHLDDPVPQKVLTSQRFKWRGVKALFFDPKRKEYHYLELEIRPSTIKAAGMGVFAIDTIPKGWYAFYKGVAKSFEGCNPHYSWTVYQWNDKGEDDDMSEDSEKIQYYIDATNPETSNWCRYVNCANHSIKNNMDMDQHYSRILYRTTRKIRYGEELFIDYGHFFRTENLGVDDAFYEKVPRVCVTHRRNVIRHVHSDREYAIPANIFECGACADEGLAKRLFFCDGCAEFFQMVGQYLEVIPEGKMFCEGCCRTRTKKSKKR